MPSDPGRMTVRETPNELAELIEDLHEWSGDPTKRINWILVGPKLVCIAALLRSLPPPPPPDAEAVRLAERLEEVAPEQSCQCDFCRESRLRYGNIFKDAAATIRRLAGREGA